MSDYTVEATLARVSTEDGWVALRRMTDVVPGTILIEDPAEPVLIFPVSATDPQQAAIFIEGVASVASLEILTGDVYPTPPPDYDDDEQDRDAVQRDRGFAPDWLGHAEDAQLEHV